MSNGPVNTVTPLAAKLGHTLLEVRERALENICSKVESGLLSLPDLANNNAIVQNLLAWFQHDSLSRQSEVLDLLGRIALHEQGAKCLVDFGALHTLHELRNALPQTEQQSLENILRTLFASTSETELSIHVSPLPIPVQSFTRVQAVEQRHASTSFRSPSSSARSETPTTTLVDKRVDSWRFALVSLPRSDERHLFDLALRMKVDDNVMVENALLDVHRNALRDFPAEVFLQRPQVLLGLLDLLHSLDNHILLTLVSLCLTDLIQGLFRAIQLYKDIDSRPPPRAPDTDSQLDMDVEEMQYPPRGCSAQTRSSSTVRDGLSLRNNMSPEFFASTLLSVCLPTLTTDSRINLLVPILLDVLPLLFAEAIEQSIFIERVNHHLAQLSEALRFHQHELDSTASSSLLLVLELTLQFLEHCSVVNFDMPQALIQDLASLLCSERLGESRPDIRDRLLIILKSATADSAIQNFARSRVIIASLERLDSLSSVVAMDVRLSIIADALEGISFRPQLLSNVLMHLIDCFVAPVEESRRETRDEECLTVLLGFMSHFSVDVRAETYRSLLALVERLIIEPMSASDKLKAYSFLIAPKFIHEVVVGGLCTNHDSATELLVKSCSAFPSIFTHRLTPFNALLNLYATEDSALTGIITLLNREHHDLIVSIRRLFHTDPRIRCAAKLEVAPAAVSRITDAAIQERFLAHVTHVTDPFHCVTDTTTTTTTTSDTPPTFFREDDVRNLLNIFCSLDLDEPLRRSAAEQLTIILSDIRFVHLLLPMRVLNALSEQLRIATHHLVEPDAPHTPPNIVLLTMRLLAHREHLAVSHHSAQRLGLNDTIDLLLPYIFHVDDVVRELVADVIGFHIWDPVVLGVASTTLQAPPTTTTTTATATTATTLAMIEYCLPAPIVMMLSLVSTRLRLTPINHHTNMKAPRNAAMVAMVDEYLALKKPTATSTAPLERSAFIAARLQTLACCTSHEELRLTVSALRAWCLVDAASAAILASSHYTASVERFFRLAPGNRDDEYDVLALLSCISVTSSADVVLELVCCSLLPHVTACLNANADTNARLSSVTGEAPADIFVHGVLHTLYTLIRSPTLTSAMLPLVYNALFALLTSPDLPPTALTPLLTCFVELGGQPTLYGALQRDAVDLISLSTALLSDNRVPNAFVTRARTRACALLLLLLLRFSPPPCCFLANNDGALRWLWRLLSDRESALRAVALNIFARLTQFNIEQIADAVTASASPGTSLNDTALRLAADTTQAPVVRSAALTMLACTHTSLPPATLDTLTAILRAPVTPQLASAVVLLLTHVPFATMLPMLMSSDIFTRLLHYIHANDSSDSTGAQRPWNAAASLRTVALLSSLAITAVEARAVLQHEPLLRSVVSALTHCVPSMAEPYICFLVQSSRHHASTVVRVFAVDTALDCFVSLVRASSSSSSLSSTLLTCTCELIMRYCNALMQDDAQRHPASTHCSSALTLAQLLVRLLVQLQQQQTYYIKHDDEAVAARHTNETDTACIGAALASLLASCSSHTTTTDITCIIDALVTQAAHLHALALARTLANAPITALCDELQFVLRALQGAYYAAEPSTKALCATRTAHVIARCWRLHDSVRSSALSVAMNMAAKCAPARQALAGASLKARSVSLLAMVARHASSTHEYAFLHTFAADAVTVPLLLRCGVVEGALHALLAKRIRSAPLKFLACVAVERVGRVALLQAVLPKYLERVLELVCHRAVAVRVAALRLLHNLSFCTSSKVSFVQCRRTVATLVSVLTAKRRDGVVCEQHIASAMLWSVVYDCQKATALVREQLNALRLDLDIVASRHDEVVRHNIAQRNIMLALSILIAAAGNKSTDTGTASNLTTDEV